MCSAWPVKVCCSTPSACTHNTVRYTYRIGCRPADLRTSRSRRRSAELLLERGGDVIAVVLVNLQLLRGHQVSEALAGTSPIPYHTCSKNCAWRENFLTRISADATPAAISFGTFFLALPGATSHVTWTEGTRQVDQLHATFTARSESMVGQGT